MPLLACLGHWYASLLYVVPVAAIVGALGVQHLRDRRSQPGGRVHRDDLDDLMAEEPYEPTPLDPADTRRLHV
jgi:hypothetical protein